MTIWSARCWMTTLTNLISLERQMTVMLMKIGRMGNSLVQCEPEDEEDEGDRLGPPPGTSTWPWSLSPEVPFIVVILYLTLKQAVAWLLVLVDVAVIWRARDIVIININNKHLPDAVIIEMLLLMSSEYPKNKVLFFFCLLPPSTKRQSVDGFDPVKIPYESPKRQCTDVLISRLWDKISKFRISTADFSSISNNISKNHPFWRTFFFWDSKG